MHPTLKLSSKPHLHGDDSLKSQLSTGNCHSNSQLTSIYEASRSCNIQIIANYYYDQYILYESNQLASNEYWTAHNQKRNSAKDFSTTFYVRLAN